jgi:RNA polymerase sigma-70 factor (ECF subfamily)
LEQIEVDTDCQLVDNVLSGNKNAFDMLVLRHQHKVYGLVSRFVSDSAEAEDICQEAFIKAYRALPSFRGDSAFYTWLYRIAINTAKNHVLARKRRPFSNDMQVEEAEISETNSALSDIADPESNLATQNLKKAIFDAIEELPDDLRTAFTLREFSGLSYEDITEVMGCPVGTVRSRIFRAREMIDGKIRALL